MNCNRKPKEYWKQQNGLGYQWKIHIKIALRKFNRETKGLGILFIMIMAVLITSSVANLTSTGLFNQHTDRLKIACISPFFYSLNFNACENANARPPSGTPPLMVNITK